MVIELGTKIQKEAELVAGTFRQDRKAQNCLFKYCQDYYKRSYKGLFFVDEETSKEIFQNSFIKLWENIEAGIISASKGIVIGKDAKPLKGSLLTYFMSIAKYKYLEYVRDNPLSVETETVVKNLNDPQELINILYGNDINVQYDIIADLVSKMSKRCKEILTKYYYEGKTYDVILLEIPSIRTKEVLKTKKHKCIQNLKLSANEIYKGYLNS